MRRLARSWPASQDRAGKFNSEPLFDEFADFFVDGFVGGEGGMRHARGFMVRRPAEDDAFVGVDDFVARRPPGAVADGAGRLVSGVQFAEEFGADLHLLAGDLEGAGVRRFGAVVRAAEGDPVVDLRFTAEELDVPAAVEAAHRVGDDVDLRRTRIVFQQRFDVGLDFFFRVDLVRLRGVVAIGHQGRFRIAVFFETADHRVPERRALRPAVDEQDRVLRRGAGRDRGGDAKRRRSDKCHESSLHGSSNLLEQAPPWQPALTALSIWSNAKYASRYG